MFNTLALAVLASIFLASSGHTVAGKNVQASVNTEEAAVRKFVLEEIKRWTAMDRLSPKGTLQTPITLM